MPTRDPQLYLRAEPTEESRDLLVLHRRGLNTTLDELRLTPRFVSRNDLHRTEIFLGAPSRWSHLVESLGGTGEITADDLLQLVDLLKNERTLHPGVPMKYDVFFTGPTTAVFVLLLDPRQPSLLPALLRHAEQTLRTWETTKRLPPGGAQRLLAHRQYPLARDQRKSKPHITLARGRVSPERQRDVRRTVQGSALASTVPISFAGIDVREVRSTDVLTHYAP